MSTESVLSVHTPIIKFKSCSESSFGIYIFLLFAFWIIWYFSKYKSESLPGGNNLKSAFLVVGKAVPPTFIYNPATLDCQSNSTL